MFKVYKQMPLYRENFTSENMGVYTQSKDFYNFLKSYGVRTLFFVEEDKDGKPIIGTFCYKSNPYLNRFWGGNKSKFLIKALNKIDRFCFRNNHLGFVYNFQNICERDFIEFIKNIKDYKTKHGERFYIECFLSNDKVFCEALIRGLKTESIDGKIIGTTRINIQNTSLEFLKKELRTDIKYGIKSDLLITRINNQNIGDFTRLIYKQFKSSYTKNRVAIPSYNYYKGIIVSGAELFLVYKNNQLLGGDYIYKSDGIALAMSTFTTELGYGLRLRSGEYLRWYIINYLREIGIKLFDLNMIAIKGSEKQERINFYKLKWGGEIIYGINIVL